MEEIDPNSPPHLDVCVLNALELLIRRRLPHVDFPKNKRYFVVGSGNALAAGRIIFRNRDVAFANESTYTRALRPIKSIDHAILISASGGKHAPEIAKYLTRSKKIRKPLILLTCNPKAGAQSYIARKKGKVLLFPHVAEPYTYNTSTYMGMILRAETKTPQKEAEQILQHINGPVNSALKKFARNKNFRNYKAFYLLVPEEFDLIGEMLKTKFVELFGRKIARDVFTSEQAKHATTLVESDTELFISFDYKKKWWSGNWLNIPLPRGASAGYTAIMAIGYYVIGKIQAQKDPWFKDSLQAYCDKASSVFREEIKPIVHYEDC